MTTSPLPALPVDEVSPPPLPRRSMWTILPFALAIFVGAFLLFAVQPIIGKYILPWFGGSPGVWTTCMLFFQVVLLLGYAYAHWTTQRLGPLGQACLHVVLLGMAVALLPIIPADSWKPSPEDHPTWRIVALLAVCLGFPYFALSATSPLLQSWFSKLHPGRSPYRLYALSNVGSLLALVGYPFVIETTWTRTRQAELWSLGMAGFAVACAICAAMMWRRAGTLRPKQDEAAPAGPLGEAAGDAHGLSSGRIAGWVLLPACGSALLLATTNKVCQDVAVIPFLWVAPLALYLLSFIICFDHARWYQRPIFVPLLGAAMYYAYWVLSSYEEMSIKWQVIIYCAVLAVCCMVCHGETFRLRPRSRHLTAFYLCISLGGALGGAFVALLAPLVFSTFLEYPISVTACGVLGLIAVASDRTSLLGRWRSTQVASGMLAAALAVAAVYAHRRVQSQFESDRGKRVATLRNFYGVLTVFDVGEPGNPGRYLKLDHGGIRHGIQFVDPARSERPSSYYGPYSGVGLTMKHFGPDKPRRVGIVGLGTGTMAAWAKRGDVFRFYEINPLVEQLALETFTYLDDARKRGARIDVVMGDARLGMEAEASRGTQDYDVIALDAFSGDAIPVHLLTREAFDVYLRLLKRDGVIAVHVSNRHLRLRPIVDRLAGHLGLGTRYIVDDVDERRGRASEEEERELVGMDDSSWVLVSRDDRFLRSDEIASEARPRIDLKGVRLWTDDDTNLFEILREPE